MRRQVNAIARGVSRPETSSRFPRSLVTRFERTCLPVLALAIGLVGREAGARAEQAPPAVLALHWSAPAACPDASSVAADVGRILGHWPDAAAAAREARATVSEEGQGAFRLRLETTEQDGLHVRELRGETCDGIARAAALIIALALEPRLAPPAPRASAIAEGAAPALPAPAASSSAPLSTARGPDAGARRARPLIVPGLRVAGGFDATSLPRVAPEAAVALAILMTRVRIEAAASYAASERSVVPGGIMPAGADLRLAYGSARGCYVLLPTRLEISGCAAFEVGSMFGTGFGVNHPASAEALWLAPSLGGLGVFRLTPYFGVALEAFGVVPLLRQQFVLGEVGAVFQPAPAGFRGALGLDFRLE